MTPVRPAMVVGAALTFFSAVGWGYHTNAETRRVGDFDFYVLALSWSPSYCRAAGSRAEPLQCQSTRPFAFVVHGLWPQYEAGYPRDCPTSASPPDRQLVDSVLDLMPSRALVRHQWRKHGACTGHSAPRYFATVRQARDKINIPDRFHGAAQDRRVAPHRVEQEFLRANPGLGENAIAVTCDRRHLREVRICLTKSLHFRDCPEIDRRACRSQDVALPGARPRERK